MGTSSKGRNSFVSPWRQNNRSANGAFGQSHYEKICNDNVRRAKIEAIRSALEFDEGMDKDVANGLRKRLKELTQ